MAQRRPAFTHALALLLCAASTTAFAGDLRVDSRVPGVHIAAVATLPPPRHPQPLDEGACGNAAIAPKTAAGRAAAALGWHVTSEVQAAGYTSIGIFSHAESQASNTCIILDGNIAVIGSNYGSERTPGWVHNLRATPEVEVEHRGRTVAATARRLGRESAESVWTLAESTYAGYAQYRLWAQGREITVWVLCPRDA